MKPLENVVAQNKIHKSQEHRELFTTAVHFLHLELRRKKFGGMTELERFFKERRHGKLIDRRCTLLSDESLSRNIPSKRTYFDRTCENESLEIFFDRRVINFRGKNWDLPKLVTEFSGETPRVADTWELRSQTVGLRSQGSALLAGQVKRYWQIYWNLEM